MAKRESEEEHRRFSASLEAVQARKKQQAHSDIEHLEDESGRKFWRWQRSVIALSFVAAFVVVLCWLGTAGLLWALALLIPPVAITLEAASTRQYHRYRAAMQAMIDGRIQQQKDAARAAAAAAKKAEEEAAKKKAEEEAKKKKETAKKAPSGGGGSESGSGIAEPENDASDAAADDPVETARIVARALETLPRGTKLVGIINTNDPRLGGFDLAPHREEPATPVNEDERLRQKAQQTWQIPYERDESEN